MLLIKKEKLDSVASTYKSRPHSHTISCIFQSRREQSLVYSDLNYWCNALMIINVQPLFYKTSALNSDVEGQNVYTHE